MIFIHENSTRVLTFLYEVYMKTPPLQPVPS